jgi:ABC-type transport system involved in cytochrome c biogenesis ATPase subunit
MNSNKVLQVDSVTKVYGKGDNKTEALRGISFDVLEGEFLGIMGASGSGKTTLLNCIATMIKPSTGRVLLKNKDVSSLKGVQLADYRGQEIGYLFQEFELLDNLTARENIILPLSLHGVAGHQAEQELRELANRLDITDVLDKFHPRCLAGRSSAWQLPELLSRNRALCWQMSRQAHLIVKIPRFSWICFQLSTRSRKKQLSWLRIMQMPPVIALVSFLSKTAACSMSLERTLKPKPPKVFTSVL